VLDRHIPANRARRRRGAGGLLGSPRAPALNTPAKDPSRTETCRAVPAGRAQADDSPALTIILEPEAAALAARRATADAGGPQAMLEGETFMVLDAGGGTVDITVHKVGAGDSRLPACLPACCYYCSVSVGGSTSNLKLSDGY
jgi:hypothetical protein